MTEIINKDIDVKCLTTPESCAASIGIGSIAVVQSNGTIFIHDDIVWYEGKAWITCGRIGALGVLITDGQHLDYLEESMLQQLTKEAADKDFSSEKALVSYISLGLAEKKIFLYELAFQYMESSMERFQTATTYTPRDQFIFAFSHMMHDSGSADICGSAIAFGSVATTQSDETIVVDDSIVWHEGKAWITCGRIGALGVLITDGQHLDFLEESVLQRLMKEADGKDFVSGKALVSYLDLGIGKKKKCIWNIAAKYMQSAIERFQTEPEHTPRDEYIAAFCRVMTANVFST